MSFKKSKPTRFEKFVPRHMRKKRFKEFSYTKMIVGLALATGSAMFNPASVQTAQATASGVDTTCAALESKPAYVNFRSGSTITLAIGDTLTVARPSTSTLTHVGAIRAPETVSEAVVQIRGVTYSNLIATVASGSTVSHTATEAGDHRVNIESGFNGAVTISCTVAPVVTDTTEDVQKNFTETQVVNQLTSLYDQMSANARGSLDNGGSNSINGQGFNVSANAINPVGYNKGDTAYSDFNVWVSGRYTHFDSTSLDGHTSDLVAGIDYKISDSLLYGVLVGYGRTDFDTLVGTTTGSLKADAITGGVYAAKRLENGLTFDALLAYTSTNYDLVNGTATASFDANRVGLSLGVYNSFALDNGWVIQPHAKLIVAREKQDAYTDSLSNSVAERTITSGRFAIGPRVYFDKDADFSPWVAVDLEYDFSNAAATASSVASFDDNFSARPAVGFNYSMDEQTQVQFNANVGGLGSDAYTSYGLQVELNRRF